LNLNPTVIPLREDADGSVRTGVSPVLLDLVLYEYGNDLTPEEIVASVITGTFS
jgi:hypothetical protein